MAQLRGNAVLEGDLSDFTLPDILRLLAFTSKSGRLRLEGANASGRIDLIDGRVRDASSAAGRLPLARRLLGLGVVDGEVLIRLLRDAGSLPTDRAFARDLVREGHAEVDAVTEVLHEQTVDAVFDLLRWNTGSFRFDIGGDRDSSPPDLAVPIDELLEEADRRLAAWPEIEAATGAGDAVVTIARPRSGDRTSDIDADGWALLAFVDGRRTVNELVALSGRGQFDTRRTLGALIESGVVRVGDPHADGTVQRLLAAHRALADVEVARAADGGGEPAPPEPAAAAASAPEGPPPPTVDPAGQQPPPVDPAAQQPPGGPPADDDVTPLRTRVRPGRLTTDPTVDADLVNRLIDGVEGL